MYLLIGNLSKVELNDPNKLIIFDSVCMLKNLTDSYDLLLIDEEVNKEGLIKSKDIVFEEIIITIKVNKVISNVKSEKLENICNYHNIDLIYFNFT